MSSTTKNKIRSGRFTSRSPAGMSVWGRMLIGSLILMGILGVLALAISSYGVCRGEEFSPDRFLRRSFLYYRIPLINLQVTPLYRTRTTNPLEMYVRTNNLIPPSTGNNRWSVVEYYTGDVIRYTGDAKILCTYLDLADDGGDLVWHEWSKKNRELAKVLWLNVAQLARDDLYYLIPELMNSADTAKDPESLRAELDRILIEAFQRRATAEQNMENHEVAVKFLSRVLEKDPNRADMLRARAVSHEALGRQGLARSDRQKADAIAAKNESE